MLIPHSRAAHETVPPTAPMIRLEESCPALLSRFPGSRTRFFVPATSERRGAAEAPRASPLEVLGPPPVEFPDRPPPALPPPRPAAPADDLLAGRPRARTHAPYDVDRGAADSDLSRLGRGPGRGFRSGEHTSQL